MNPDDLFNDLKTIKAQLAQLSQRPAPVTAEQLEKVAARPITVDAKALAGQVLPHLKQGLPNTESIKQAGDDAVKQIQASTSAGAELIGRATQGVPRVIRVTGDVYGFTNWVAASVYGLILVAVVAGAWLVCAHYREQAQETVIYQQAQEIIRQRNYYNGQIQDYKRTYPKYAKLFPAYDDKGFWDQFK